MQAAPFKKSFPLFDFLHLKDARALDEALLFVFHLKEPSKIHLILYIIMPPPFTHSLKEVADDNIKTNILLLGREKANIYQ